MVFDMEGGVAQGLTLPYFMYYQCSMHCVNSVLYSLDLY